MSLATDQAIYEISKISGYDQQRFIGFLKQAEFSEENFFDLCELNSIYVLADKRIIALPESLGTFRQKWYDKFEKTMTRFSEFATKREEWVKALLQTCEKEKIDVILLKGSLIGVTLAPFFSYKKMNDIDLLIQRKDGLRFLQVVKSLGFRSVGALFSGEDLSEKNHHTPPYYSPDMSCLLGIHWELCSPYAVWKPDSSSVWENKVEIQCLSCKAFRMSWEHNFLHLCFHLPLFKTGPRELQDIAEMIKVTKLNWKLILNLSEQWKVTEPVYRILTLVQELLPDEAALVTIASQLASEVPLWIQKETELRKKNLATTRSTFVAKIEKAYSISVLSKNPFERFKAWLITWIWTFFPPQKELSRLIIGRKKWQQRCLAPIYIIKAMARDYGMRVFVVITVVNVFRAMVSLVMAILQISGEKIMESEQYKIYKTLE